MPINLPGKDTAPSRTQAVAEPSASRVVSKPIPAAMAKDPRGYQIAQLRRRFAPQETKLAGGATSLVFKLAPSDPDFPFDLDFLECDLRIPKDYPKDAPALHVRNENVPRGFAINIERGWDTLVAEREGATLLALTNLLDKNLEGFLSAEKAETVKIVAFKDTRHLELPMRPVSPAAAKITEAPSPSKAQQSPKQTAPQKLKQHKPAPKPYVREPSYTKEEISEARQRRAQETRQLENRMSRMPMYRRSPDGIVYTLPLEARRREELPPGLQGVRTVHLIVPLLYPLQQLRVQLNEVDSTEAEPVEDLFAEKAAGQKHMTLTSHMNYLASNLNVLAKMAAFQAKVAEAEVREEEEKRKAEEAGEPDKGKGLASGVGTDTEEFVKSHIKVIPRPPEWGRPHDSESDGSSGDSDSADGDDSYENTGSEHEDGAAQKVGQAAASNQIVEKGTAMSFPTIELYGIELLQVEVLNLNVKCARCKTVNEITGLKHGVEKTGSCSKCANGFAVCYSQQLVHQNSTRAGLIDTGGCTVADMLPSTFVPVCAGCSTPSAGMVSVRGATATNVCRSCHARFTFKVPEVKFLLVSPGSLVPRAGGVRKRAEKLGLHAGEPLPGRGTCRHYAKSYRWFRFSCCSKVYACDRCHDEAEEHPNEWANRMVCGFCSREQNYAVEACGFCGRSVVGRKGRGFWEGGRGTRDRRAMNRNDPRKYKRIGGSEGAKKDPK